MKFDERTGNAADFYDEDEEQPNPSCTT